MLAPVPVFPCISGLAGYFQSTPAVSLVCVRPEPMRFSDLDTPLADEIRQEIVASYFAECKKMVDSLFALKEFDRLHASAALTQEQGTIRSELLERAGERVHFVMIQREALQLVGGDRFFDDYEIPDEVRTYLRPRR